MVASIFSLRTSPSLFLLGLLLCAIHAVVAEDVAFYKSVSGLPNARGIRSPIFLSC